MSGRPSKIPILDRLMARLTPEPNTGCWIWTGAVTKAGYGLIGFDGGLEYVHRLMFLIHNGPIPTGLDVCHKCDCPPCGNPDHLFSGTRLDNMADAVRKRRVHLGESNGMSILTAGQVAEIRARYKPYEVTAGSLAKEYGVGEHYIYDLVRGDRWRTVGGGIKGDGGE